MNNERGQVLMQTTVGRLYMKARMNQGYDVSVEVLEAAFAVALSAPDFDEARVRDVRAKLACWHPDPRMVAESMLLWASGAAIG